MLSLISFDVPHRSRRDAVYLALLKRMSPEHKFSTAAKLCQEVLGGVADGVLGLAECEEVLGDALRVLASKDIKVGTDCGPCCLFFQLWCSFLVCLDSASKDIKMRCGPCFSAVVAQHSLFNWMLLVCLASEGIKVRGCGTRQSAIRAFPSLLIILLNVDVACNAWRLVSKHDVLAFYTPGEI